MVSLILNKIKAWLPLIIIGIIVLGIFLAHRHYQSLVKERDKWKHEFVKLKAESKPDTIVIDSTVVYEDSSRISMYRAIVKRLRSQLSDLGVADTVIESLTDTIKILAESPCDKKIRADYLYQDNGVTAHIGALANCRTNQMTFAVGAYAEPTKRQWGWGIDVFGGYNRDGPVAGAGLFASTPWSFDAGLMIIDDIIGIKLSYRF